MINQTKRCSLKRLVKYNKLQGRLTEREVKDKQY